VGGGAGEACVESGTALTQITDTENPGDGEVWWYLVRGRHACGIGTYGYAAENGTPTTERITAACP
jgi:hypothetical protein